MKIGSKVQFQLSPGNQKIKTLNGIVLEINDTTCIIKIKPFYKNGLNRLVVNSNRLSIRTNYEN